MLSWPILLSSCALCLPLSLLIPPSLSPLPALAISLPSVCQSGQHSGCLPTLAHHYHPLPTALPLGSPRLSPLPPAYLPRAPSSPPTALVRVFSWHPAPPPGISCQSGAMYADEGQRSLPGEGQPANSSALGGGSRGFIQLCHIHLAAPPR